MISSKRGILLFPSFVTHFCNSEKLKSQVLVDLLTFKLIKILLQSYISIDKSWKTTTFLSVVNQASISISSIPLSIASK